MKKFLFVFFALAVVMGSTSLHAQSFSMVADDEREIPLDPSGPVEGGPITRSIIISPANAYVSGDVVTIVFNKDMPSANVSITNAVTGEQVFYETYSSPTFITLDLSANKPGEYHLEIASEEFQLSGNFTL